jgi:hypothetical protein
MIWKHSIERLYRAVGSRTLPRRFYTMSRSARRGPPFCYSYSGWRETPLSRSRGMTRTESGVSEETKLQTLRTL